MANHLNFTKREIEKLPIPATVVAYYYDTRVRGLRLGVHPKTGRRTFSLYRKVKGAATTIPIGAFPELTIEEARGRASELNAQIAKGENPREGLRASNNPTLGEFFERYLADHRVRGKPAGEAWRRGTQQTFDRYLRLWANRRLSEVTPADLERLHTEIATPTFVVNPKTGKRKQVGGPVAANRVVTRLVAPMFVDAKYWGVYDGPNPAKHFETIDEFPRTRLLNRNGEMQAFREALQAEQDVDLRLYLLLRTLNGIREQDILKMRWADLDLDSGGWSIRQTKTGKPQVVALAAPVVAELRGRTQADMVWVFPGHRRGTHLTTVARKWKVFRAALGLNDLQPRDLRRTFGSWALWAGVPREAIASAMGHSPGSRITASIYAFADEEMNRATVDVTTRKMLEAGNATQD